ncbi:MAG: hypothetical protein ACTSYQ_04190, partial [Candidatus Odinarchaeia archaeon]
ESYEEAVKYSRPPVAYIVSGANNEILSLFDIKEDKVLQIRNNLRKKNFVDAFNLVDDEMINTFSITGNWNDCINKIEGLVDVGIDQFVFGSPLGPETTKIWCNYEIFSKETAIRNIITKILSSYFRE